MLWFGKGRKQQHQEQVGEPRFGGAASPVAEAGPQPETKERVVRVFISSTFRDMFRERDILVKRIFPQLRKLCEERFVTWGEVDLRWGVPDEKKAEGKVLPVCLEEIRRCRPYFIGILGERYGSLPEELPQDLLEREPWLKEHQKHSLTELEIWHGVLNDPKMAGRSFFYFRDPAYLKHLPDGASPADFAAESPEATGKLTELKTRIRASGLPVRENYATPEKLGDLVLEDLTKVICELYPLGSEPTPLDREAMLHEAFAQSRARVYIGRDEYFERLDEHAAGDGPPLVVLGDSGSGKSALLANWALKYREGQKDDLLILHFTGASPASSDWAAMLRRIMGEFKRRFDFKEEIPDKPDALRAAFANWLHMAAAKGKVILILDALNQLDDRDGAPDLVWLPPAIPANVRLFLSTLPGRPLDDLKKRNWPTLTIQPFTTDERARFIKDYLAQYRKELSPAQASRIAAAKQAENPLFLQALLEELRLFGKYEELEQRINLYLGAQDIPALYGLVLARYEEDYEDDRPGLVGDAMTAIWAARRGLSEVELLDILGKDVEPLPRAYWSRLFLASEQALVSKAGLLSFFHDHLRAAVRNRYLRDEQQQSAAHSRLANYFEKQVPGPRRIDELPWQLAEAKSWQRLYDLLAGLDFFERAWNANQFDVKAYWAQVEAGSEQRMTAAYGQVIKAPERVSDTNLSWHLSGLLENAGHLDEALALRTHLATRFRDSQEWASAYRVVIDCAALLQSTGDLKRATAIYREVERSSRKAKDTEVLGLALGNMACILAATGEPDAAIKLHDEEERIYRATDDKGGLARCLNNQAGILYSRGDLTRSMELYGEVERLSRESGNLDVLAVSLNNQGQILVAQGDLDGAMALYEQAEQICRKLGNKEGLQRSLANKGTVLRMRGEIDEAAALFQQAEGICRELGNRTWLAKNLGHQALVAQTRGDLDRALELYATSERIFRELACKEDLQTVLGNEGNIFASRGNRTRAMQLYKQQEGICRELGHKAGLQLSLGNEALILKAEGDLSGAMRLLKEQDCICQELGDKAARQTSLGNQALILQSRGDSTGERKLLREQERICREIGNRDGLAMCLYNQALALSGTGDKDGAIKLYDEVILTCQHSGNKEGLARAQSNKGSILYSRGDLDGSMSLYRESERICREIGFNEGIAISLLYQGAILYRLDRTREGLPLAEEAYRLASQHGLIALAQQVKPILDAIRAKLG